MAARNAQEARSTRQQKQEAVQSHFIHTQEGGKRGEGDRKEGRERREEG